MKVLVLILLFCTGIYLFTKATIKPSTIKISNNTGRQSCIAPNTEGINPSNHKSCCIIMDRASVILKQNTRHEAQTVFDKTN